MTTDHISSINVQNVQKVSAAAHLHWHIIMKRAPIGAKNPTQVPKSWHNLEALKIGLKLYTEFKITHCHS